MSRIGNATGILPTRLALATILLLFGACTRPAHETWAQAWIATDDFKSPESAAISERHGAIFVSNVNGYEKNGAGFISRLSLTGEIKALIWIDGLNAPTGLAADGDVLWAADFDRLVKIDIPSRTLLGEYLSDDETPLLNDVALGDEGDVYVTGSVSNTVYKLENGRLVPWLKDDVALGFANGVDVTQHHVVVAAERLVRIRRKDRRVEIIGDPTTLNDLESVTVDGKGGYYVSGIGDRPLVYVRNNGKTAPLLEGREFVADFSMAGDLLAAPVSVNAVAGYRREDQP